MKDHKVFTYSVFKNVCTSWKILFLKTISSLFFFLIISNNFANAQRTRSVPTDEQKAKEVAQVEIYGWFSSNPIGVYLLDVMEKAPEGKGREVVEQAYKKIKGGKGRAVAEALMPDIKLQMGATLGGRKKFGVGSATLKLSASKEKNWSSDQIIKLMFDNEPAQVKNGTYKSKMYYHAEKLAEDIYKCRNNSHCNLKSDSGYWYLYQNILKNKSEAKHNLWSKPFPELESVKDGTGKKEFKSIEEMRILYPVAAKMVDDETSTEQRMEYLDDFGKKLDQVNEVLEKGQSDLLEKAIEQAKNSRQVLVDQGINLGDREKKDPVLVALEDELSTYKTGQMALKKQLQKGEIKQTEWSEKNKKFQSNIDSQEKKITAHKFESGLNQAQNYTRMMLMGADIVGAPKEVIQFGTTLVAGVDIAKGIGPFLITGVFDPTGITLALGGFSILIDIWVDQGPSADEIIISKLEKIYENQLKMMQSLKKMEHKIDNLEKHLQEIEDLLKKVQAGSQRNFEDIKQRLKRINHNINNLAVNSEGVHRALLSSETTDADNNNMAAVSSHQASVDDRYQQCYTQYASAKPFHKRPSGSNTEEGVLHYDCLSDCVFTRFKEGISSYDLCGKECSANQHVSCDSGCVQKIIENIRIEITAYNNCKVSVDDIKFYKLEGGLTAMYENDIETYDASPYLTTITNNKTYESTKGLMGHDISARVHTFSDIADDMNKMIKKYSEKLNNLGTSKLSKQSNVKDLKKTSSQSVRTLKNPDSLDKTFETYVESMSLLPEKNTPMQIDGSGYSYRLDHLNNMCIDVKNITDLSRSSRDNIRNAIVLFHAQLDKIKQEMDTKFTGDLKKLVQDQDDIEEKRSKTKDSDMAVSKDCNCNRDYTGVPTGILSHIREQEYSIVRFLNESEDEIVKGFSDHLSDSDIENKGFEIVDHYENRCHKIQSSGEKKITKGDVDNLAQLRMLQDTFESVRIGEEQGGCWFIDKFGLITGHAGERIRLYQKTGTDHLGYPALEPLCSVFVTKTKGRWFAFWDWDEPVARAVCLEAELDIFDTDEFLSFPNRKISDSQIYWLTKNKIERGGTEPRSLSAVRYLKNIIQNICPSCDIERMKTEGHQYIKQKIKGYDEDHILWGINIPRLIECSQHKAGCSVSEIDDIIELGRYAIEEIYNDESKTDYWSWDKGYNMLIDTHDIVDRMGDKQWVDNIPLNRDSFGRCNRFACLLQKDVPVYVSDRTGWKKQAEKEIKSFKNSTEKFGEVPLFSETINEIYNSWYNVISLIEAGYGDRLNTDLKLRSLRVFMDNLGRNIMDLNSSDFSIQLKKIYEFHTLLQNTVVHLKKDESMKKQSPYKEEFETIPKYAPLIPSVSSKEYGLGFPTKRNQALDTFWKFVHGKIDIKDSDSDQCKKNVVFNEGIL